jgi:glutamate 5-kinase
MVIANGMTPDILKKLFSGQQCGTLFVPKHKKLASRKCWIAFNLKPQGVLVIDDGAVAALLKNGKSLLPSGITDVEGNFNVGAPVVFRSLEKTVIGIGLVNYAAADIHKIKGLKTNQIKNHLGHKPFDEVVHRDNLTITVELND